MNQGQTRTRLGLSSRMRVSRVTRSPLVFLAPKLENSMVSKFEQFVKTSFFKRGVFLVTSYGTKRVTGFPDRSRSSKFGKMASKSSETIPLLRKFNCRRNRNPNAPRRCLRLGLFVTVKFFNSSRNVSTLKLKMSSSESTLKMSLIDVRLLQPSRTIVSRTMLPLPELKIKKYLEIGIEMK